MSLSHPSHLSKFVDRLKLRSVLSADEQQAVLRLPTHVRQVSANHDFVQSGDHVDHSSFVAAGLVGRFDQDDEGRRQITAVHLPGDMADLHSFVQPHAPSALQALSVATILSVPHAALRATIGQHPGLAETFWRDCMVDAATLAQWVVNVGRRSARTRLAHLICEMAVRLDAQQEETFSFEFPVSQRQLADMTGLTPVHVNRVSKGLAADGLVILRKCNIEVQDWAALAHAGDFGPAYLQRNLSPGETSQIH